MENSYSSYDYKLLYDKINEYNNSNNDVKEFFTKFSFNEIINHNLATNNTTFIFKNAIKEDSIKSKIIQYLNKLHPQNLNKIISSIREIIFQTKDEIDELVYQCLEKIKRDNDQIRPLVAALCFELQSTYFTTANGDKIFFRKLLLTEIKNQYISSINYSSEEWSKDKSDKIMILIGTLFNQKVIDFKILKSILDDFRNNILYSEEGNQEYFEKVEKSLQQICCLLSCLIINYDIREKLDNIDNYLEEQMSIYEDKKNISKKIRLVCKNIISEYRSKN